MDIGCRSLDGLTHGLLEGSITQIYGEYATGKTAYCLQAASKVIADGRRVVYVDTENGFSPERAIQIGGEKILGDIRVYSPDDFSQQVSTIVGIEQSLPKDIGLVVVDSLVSLYRVEASGSDRRAELIGELSLQLLLLSRIARKRRIPVIVTNQVYDDFEGPGVLPLGGHTVRYWSKVMVLFTRGSSSRRYARLIRHPFVAEGGECRFLLADKGLASE